MFAIKFISFDEATGYGISSKSLISALISSGVDVTTIKITAGNPRSGGLIGDQDRGDGRHYDAVIVHTVPEYYPFWYQNEKRNNPDIRVWGYTAWETDKIPEHWPELLNLMDGIFVPCNWNKAVFEKCGVTSRVEVLPHVSEFHGETTGEKARTTPSILRPFKDSFLFYTICVWNERKNVETLIKAFAEEFSDSEKVSLVIKTGERDWSKLKRNWRKFFRWDFGESSRAFSKLNVKNRRNLIHIAKNVSAEDISFLHKRGDCFVSFTRGEGWGMGAYEAAWCAKPVIITGFGGFLDFLPKAYSYHLNYEMTSVSTEFGKKSYDTSQQWAEVNIAHAKKTMRRVFENQQEALEKGFKLQKHVREEFASAAIAEKCISILNGKKG
ncbi:glycosyltransferase [Desertivirga xinjiangensis]|uniref:glycosyltransferase n=1 Tax=Desertivirga xinjiangensis TaxID=539206 RepID=UPI00210EE98C|nr:glycosyltransferase [Pedobacter xinjiangensis]